MRPLILSRYRIGFNVISARLIVLGELSNSAIISLFLGLILNIIIFILLFLSIILIYSLLMINVETKTFEMGVMRMIGISRRGLVQLLLLQVIAVTGRSWLDRVNRSERELSSLFLYLIIYRHFHIAYPRGSPGSSSHNFLGCSWHRGSRV